MNKCNYIWKCTNVLENFNPDVILIFLKIIFFSETKN